MSGGPPPAGAGDSATVTGSGPMVAAARPENICALAARFGAALRSEGVDVPVGSMITFMAALGSLGVDTRAKVYWCGRATLVHRPEDFDTYDVVFTHFWEGIDPRSLLPQPPAAEVTLAFDDLEGDGGEPATWPIRPMIEGELGSLSAPRAGSPCSRTAIPASRASMSSSRV